MGEPGVRTLDAVSVSERVLQTMVTFDSQALLPLLASDFVLEFPYAPAPLPRVVRGASECAELFALSSGLVADLRVTACEMHRLERDDMVLALWESEGTFRQSGGCYRNRYVSLIRVRDGLVDWYAEYFDPLAAAGPSSIESTGAAGAGVRR